MDNKEFDEILRKKLESLSSGGSDDGWELFREKWQQSEAPVDDIPETEDVEPNADDLFDAKVKQNMRGLRMPFNSEHWIRLKAQLESEALFKKRLFVAKTVEILMLSLIVLCVINIWPFQNDIYEIPVDNVPMVASVQVNKSSADKYTVEQVAIDAKKAKLISQISNSFSTVISNRFIKEPSTLENKIKSNHKKSDPSIIPILPIDRIDQLEIFHFDNIQNKPEYQDDTESTNNENLGITQALSSKMELLDIPHRPMGYPELSIGTLKDKSDEKSYVSIGFGPKINLINSPFDPVYKIDAYNTLNTNFNVTAKMHKEVGPIEMYTGLGYTNTSYKPLVIKEVYQNQRNEFNHASLENIAFKTFNIPVGINYNLVDNDGLKVYASAGMDVNIVTNTNYKVFDVPANTSGFRSQFNSEIPKSEISSLTLLSQKEFNDGVFQGGALKDNLYASANIGFGIVKSVSNQASLFIEPKYSHFITSRGLGPNLDKLHAVSIDIGVKLELN